MSANWQAPPPPPSAAHLDAMRAMLLAEAAKPRWSWRRGAVQLVGLTTGLAALVALGALALEQTTVAVAAGHWLTLLLLGIAGPLSVLAALRPGRGPLPAVAGLLSLGGAAALVLTRTVAPVVLASPEWVCSASHLGVALPAMVAAAFALRRFASTTLRAVLAGVAVGTTGALLGELLCGGNASHIALFHLGAWAVATTAVTVAALRLKKSSYAP